MKQLKFLTRVAAIAFGAGGTFLSGAGNDGAWRNWEVPSGRLLQLGKSDGYALSGVAAWRETVATGSGSGTMRFFDGQSGRQKNKIEVHTGAVNALAWSRNGKFLASAHTDSTAWIWDAASGVPLYKFEGGDLVTVALAFSPDSRFLAAGTGTETRVYDVSRGNLIYRLAGDSYVVNALAWSKDGTLLASASGYNIRVWNAQTGRLARTLKGHRLTVSALAFGNGSLLASGGYDTQLRFWNAQTGTSLGAFSGHNGQIRGLAFTSDGKRLASASQDGMVALWKMP